MKLKTTKGYHPLLASIEHLVPVSAKRQHELQLKINMVPASTFINTMLGNAPLVVKFGLKDFFKEFTMHPALNEDKMIKVYKRATHLYLDQFKRHEHYFWHWKALQCKKKISEETKLERMQELYEEYLLLLTDEEKAIGAYIKWEEKA